MNKPTTIDEYHARLEPEDRAICDLLRTEIDSALLPDATSKVWHGHPVWFLDGNPIVGYDRLKHALRLMFWSGQSFETPGLAAEGSFKAGEVRYQHVDEVDVEALRAWLAESRTVQWNYRDIRRTKGKLMARVALPIREPWRTPPQRACSSASTRCTRASARSWSVRRPMRHCSSCTCAWRAWRPQHLTTRCPYCVAMSSSSTEGALRCTTR